MPGGIMQLTAYGAQDLYLTGNPDITFFKYVYRRYSNFSMEYIELNFDKMPTFTQTRTTTCHCKIGRNADLLYDGYIVYSLPALFTHKTDVEQANDFYAEINQGFLLKNIPLTEPISFVKNIGNNLINTVDISIGGLVVDKQYGKWLSIWNELTLSDGKLRAYRNLTSSDTFSGSYTTPLSEPLVNNSSSSAIDQNVLLSPAKKLYVPLPFWFCQNPGLAIPLIALQYTDVVITVEFNPLSHIVRIGLPHQSPDFFFDTVNNPDYDSSLNRPNNYIEQNSVYNTYLRRLLTGQLENDQYNYSQINVLDRYTPGWKQNSYLLMNYIYLSDDERIRFAQNTHEYLITQTQNKIEDGLKGSGSSMPRTNYINISTFNHPVKELVWVLQRPEVQDTNDWDNYILVDSNTFTSYKFIKDVSTHILDNKYLLNIGAPMMSSSVLKDTTTDEHTTDNVVNHIMKLLQNNTSIIDNQNPEVLQGDTSMNYVDILRSAKLIFNGVDRFSEQDHGFFSHLQAYKYHSNTGLPGTYMYSFALKPEDEQPSGTCNMSRLKNAQLAIQIGQLKNAATQKFTLYLFARNYNVFRIMAGIGSLVFAN